MNRVVLRKLSCTKKTNRFPIVGKLKGFPTVGRKLIIELDDDGEYITTPVVRMLQMVSDGTLYIETANTRYSMRVKK